MRKMDQERHMNVGMKAVSSTHKQSDSGVEMRFSQTLWIFCHFSLHDLFVLDQKS